MKFLGVKVDFNKDYTPAELAQLEEELEEAYQRAARKMILWTAILTTVMCCLALVVRLSRG